MKVKLEAYTRDADAVCGMAAKTCISEEIQHLRAPDTGEPIPRTTSLRMALALNHESVAEHANFTFSIEGISRACSHQLVRHRLASYSQQSQRYVNMDWFEYVTPTSLESPDKMVNYRFYDDETTGFYLEGFGVKDAYDKIMHDIAVLYRKMVIAGIPEEDARYILPNACTTNIVVTMNARELRHFFRLRCCSRAQWEIRELANKMLKSCKAVAPILFEDAGPSCKATGRCPEGVRSCGKYRKDTNNVPIGKVSE